ncbi:hypothetical protein Nepgr_023828 [Nepenthes gracilis]|uniref:RING-type E3 ubiquitin transferase n=1 Tax=Nepenthes gracilis TaxID=150966 RepID=A0AAD3T371_NEPGR|nr:hypothetical protein Nepgr_023828 [Nepenthes gracilis]
MGQERETEGEEEGDGCRFSGSCLAVSSVPHTKRPDEFESTELRYYRLSVYGNAIMISMFSPSAMASMMTVFVPAVEDDDLPFPDDGYLSETELLLNMDNLIRELEEMVGPNTFGLSERAVMEQLSRREHERLSSSSQHDTVPCSICLEEYEQGQGIGELDCSHVFHFECIKQWLMLKNRCPLCKTTALSL